jgi:hypothetical protein
MDKLRILPLALVCGVLSSPSLAAKGQDYTVDFTADGETVVDFIDLVPGTHGTIAADEILSWSLSSVPGDPAIFSGSSAALAALAVGRRHGRE